MLFTHLQYLLKRQVLSVVNDGFDLLKEKSDNEQEYSSTINTSEAVTVITTNSQHHDGKLWPP
jgi:hypothetical protein